MLCASLSLCGVEFVFTKKKGKKGRSGGHIWKGYRDYIMAELRPNSEIIGNFRKMENCYGHFITHQKW